MAKRTFSPGFRLSVLDVAILVGGAVASAWVSRDNFYPGMAIAFVVGHFFLFCNVLRMSRPLELVWAGVFVALAAAVMGGGVFSWPVAFTLSGAVTVAVTVAQARRPSYHGVGWRVINPRLPEWWEARQGAGRAAST
jgi:hypothetical protein